MHQKTVLSMKIILNIFAHMSTDVKTNFFSFIFYFVATVDLNFNI